MARPREYDEDQVVEAAMGAFWAHGYEATSLTDLMDATGLAKGSVYKGFGDKHTFFLRALEQYLANARRNFAAIDDDGVAAVTVLRRWLEMVLEWNLCPGPRKGCFKVNCMVELAPHDPEVRKLLRTHERSLETTMAKTIQRGVAEGSVREDIDPKTAARWLNTVVSGVSVQSKAGMTRSEGDAMMELAMRVLQKER